MMVASDADDAWCPPTFSESSLSRTWLALCTVQLASQSTLRSSSARMSSLVGMITIGRCRSSRLAGPYMSRSTTCCACPSCKLRYQIYCDFLWSVGVLCCVAIFEFIDLLYVL